MRQLYLTLVVFVVGLINVDGQQSPNLFVQKDNDYNIYFLADSLTREYHVFLNYDNVSSFHEGIAVVQKDGKYGCIDKTGKLVIPLLYDDIESFYDGFSKVKKGTSRFLMNKSGVLVCDITKFDMVGFVSDGLFLVSLNDKYGFYNTSGKEIVPLKYDYVYSFCDGVARVEVGDTFEEYVYINKAGVRIGQENFRAQGDFSEGFGHVAVDEKHGYIDKNGKIVIPLVYSSAGSFKNGFAVVSKEIESESRYGLIDKSGKEVIPCIFDGVELRTDGFVLVDTGRHIGESIYWYDEPVISNYGLYNTLGQQITPLVYNEISEFTNDFALASRNGEVFLINKEGEEIANSFKYVQAVNNIAIIEDKVDKCSLVNNKGKVIAIHDYIYLNADSSIICNDGGLLNEKNLVYQGKNALFSKNGTSLTDVKYDYIGISKEGFHIVVVDNKYGFINCEGKEVVSPKYSVVGDFFHGMAIVNDSAYYNEDYGWVGGHWGFIDQTGKEVIPMIYDAAEPFFDGLALVEKNKEKFYIDTTGKVVLKLNFDDATGFSHGLAIVVKNYKIGAIDKSGNLVIPLIYDGFVNSFDKWFLLKQGSELLLLDNVGQVVKKL